MKLTPAKYFSLFAENRVNDKFYCELVLLCVELKVIFAPTNEDKSTFCQFVCRC